MIRIQLSIALFVLGAALALPSLAASGHHHHGGGGQQQAAAAGALSEGEVRKVDQAAGKITIKHGAMPKFDMPPMTMAYRAKDKAMLEQVKAGDKIRFDAEKSGSDFVLTRMEKAK